MAPTHPLIYYTLVCPILLSQAGQVDWAQGRLQVLEVPQQEVQQVEDHQQVQEQEEVEVEQGLLQEGLEPVLQEEPQQLLQLSLDQALDLPHTAPL